METQRNIVKLGGSLGVTLPKELCWGMGLEQGDLIKLDVVLLKKGKEALISPQAPATGPAGDSAA
jgi:antitoxin component of MazEF toxin-antitoxin module